MSRDFGPDLLDLDSLGLPLVVDHLGHMDAANGVRDKGFRALLEMVKRGNTWVKLSGAYRLAAKPPFPNESIHALARALIEAAPIACCGVRIGRTQCARFLCRTMATCLICSHTGHPSLRFGSSFSWIIQRRSTVSVPHRSRGLSKSSGVSA